VGCWDDEQATTDDQPTHDCIECLDCCHDGILTEARSR
jgi:hypothetical protein